jgi:putative flippase GtrA
MKATLGQLIRYGIVGVLSNVVAYLLYIGITTAGMEHKLAMTLVYALGMAQAFLFNKRWTFGHDGALKSAFARYCASYAFGYVVNLSVLYLLVDCLGYAHQVVQGAMICVLAAMLFLLQKFWVFRTNLPLSTTGPAHS